MYNAYETMQACARLAKLAAANAAAAKLAGNIEAAQAAAQRSEGYADEAQRAFDELHPRDRADSRCLVVQAQNAAWDSRSLCAGEGDAVDLDIEANAP